MRAALRPGIRLLFSIALLSSTGGCAQSSILRVEELGDISRYRTWDWLRDPGQTADAVAEPGSDLSFQIARQIEESLLARGFRRAPGRAELLVDFAFELRREGVQVPRTGAMATLNSLHSSPSFEVQAITYETHYHEIADLRIVAIAPRERSVIWRGSLAERYEGARSAQLKDAVVQLLERMPRPRPRRGSLGVVALAR